MISVFFDKDGLYSGKKDVVIDDFSQYVGAYMQIHESIHSGSNLTVVTGNRQIFFQLENLKEFYPRTIGTRKYSLREEFANQYHVSVPDYISDQDLVADKTYLEADFRGGDSFENAIIRKFLGNFFIGDTFPYASLAEMCEKLSLDDVLDKKKIVLRKVFQQRIKGFVRKATGTYEKYILDEFVKDFDSLRADVGTYLLVKSYPDTFQEDVLGTDIYKCMKHFNILGKPFAIGDDSESNYEDRARVYLNQPAIGFDETLKYVSGARNFELEIVLAKKDSLTANDVDRVTDKFADLLRNDPEACRRISLLKAPVVLEKPDAGRFDTASWIKWAMDNYLPYKFWLELCGKTDADADEYSSEYGDWFFGNYDKLINGYPYMVYKILPLLKDDFINNQHSLMVILDNFNYKFSGELTKYMVDDGYTLLYDKPVLSMIPTETAISKRAFFTGQAYYDDGKGYDNLVSMWARNMGISMKYLPNVGSLKSLKSFNEKVVFLNYLRIDEMLHEDQSDSAQTIEARIQQELCALIKTINGNLKRLGREKDTDIYFIADHGSTRILPEQPNEIDPKYYKEKAENSDYRFIAVNDSDFEATKSAIDNLCYALDKDRYGTKQHFFIARKYNRFIRNDLKAYVHGGITPEETIVPLLHFAFDVIQCKDPEITLVNETLRFSVSTKMSLLIKNFNEFDISDLEIEIINKNIHYTKPARANIEASSSCLIELANTRVLKSMVKALNEEMTVKATYLANGRKHIFTSVLKLPMKSLQSSSSDLSDLLF